MDSFADPTPQKPCKYLVEEHRMRRKSEHVVDRWLGTAGRVLPRFEKKFDAVRKRGLSGMSIVNDMEWIGRS